MMLPILVMEDDENDVILYRRAFSKLNFKYPWTRVHDGEEGLAYLRGEGAFANRDEFPFPAVILMDLKMPRHDGIDVLEWFRANPECRVVPIIVFSSSDHEDEVRKAYDLGASGFFRKPADFSELLDLLTLIQAYWCRAVKPMPCSA